MTNLPSIFTSTSPARAPRDMLKWTEDFNSVFVDFDRFFDRFDKAIPASMRSHNSFPPVDIVKTDTGYNITIALAGYSKDDIVVEISTDNVLSVSGKIESDTTTNFLQKGIATRSFNRRWQLLDTDTIGRTTLKDGLLTITIDRHVPEVAPPTRIQIETN